jgi:hypothetical protein
LQSSEFLQVFDATQRRDSSQSNSGRQFAAPTHSTHLPSSRSQSLPVALAQSALDLQVGGATQAFAVQVDPGAQSACWTHATQRLVAGLQTPTLQSALI